MAYFKFTDEGLEYSYERISDIIPLEYANSRNIDVYLDDEWFQELIINSYSRFDGCNDKDCSRALAKMSRVSYWIKQKISLKENKENKNGTA